jgi:hypothetical protein
MKTKSVCIVQVKDISNYYWEVQKPAHAAAVQERKKTKMKLRGKRSFSFEKSLLKLVVDSGSLLIGTEGARLQRQNPS